MSDDVKMDELKKLVKALQSSLSVFTMGNEDLQKQIAEMQKQINSMDQIIKNKLSPIQDQLKSMRIEIEGTAPAPGAKNQGIKEKIDRIENHLIKINIPQYSK